jgi:hypothetical protein
MIDPQFTINYTNGQSTDISALVYQFEIIKSEEEFATQYNIELTLPTTMTQTQSFFSDIKNIQVKLPVYDLTYTLHNIFYAELVVVTVKLPALAITPTTDGSTKIIPSYDPISLICRPSKISNLYSYRSVSLSGTFRSLLTQAIAPIQFGYLSPPITDTRTVFLPNIQSVSLLFYLLEQGAYNTHSVFTFDIVNKQQLGFLYSTSDSINKVVDTVYFWYSGTDVTPTNLVALNLLPQTTGVATQLFMPPSIQQTTYTNSSFAETQTVTPNIQPTLGTNSSSLLTNSISTLVTNNTTQAQSLYDKALLSSLTIFLRFEGTPALLDLHPGQTIQLVTSDVNYKPYIGKYIIQRVTLEFDLEKKNRLYGTLLVKRYGLAST